MKRKMIFAALTAASIGLTALPSPADARGHERWRSCGGHAYEGCGYGEFGPYARRGGHGYNRGYDRGYGQGGYGGGQILTVEEFDRRIHIRERTRTKIRIRIYHD